MTEYPQWPWSGSCDPFFFKFCLNHIFGIGETIGSSNFVCRLIHRSIVHAWYNYYPKRMCLESRDLFILWEVSDNISETVQDIDRLIGNRTWPNLEIMVFGVSLCPVGATVMVCHTIKSEVDAV